MAALRQVLLGLLAVGLIILAAYLGVVTGLRDYLLPP